MGIQIILGTTVLVAYLWYPSHCSIYSRTQRIILFIVRIIKHLQSSQYYCIPLNTSIYCDRIVTRSPCEPRHVLRMESGMFKVQGVTYVPYGRRRLSPPRGAGWEPVNTCASRYLQSQEESTSASTVCKLRLQM